MRLEHEMLPCVAHSYISHDEPIQGNKKTIEGQHFLATKNELMELS